MGCMWEVFLVAGRFLANFFFAEMLLKGATWAMHHTRIKRMPDKVEDADAENTRTE